MSTLSPAIDAADLERRMAGLSPIGLGADGATTRLPWTDEDEAAGAWFGAQAAELGLRVERDPAGSRWAVPDAPGPWWAVGSHLDSVRDGGAFDGALGVAAAFAVAARASEPLAVIAFADEEGARFNTPTFGSRLLTGRLTPDEVLDRRDRDGVVLRDALAGAGVDPDGLVGAPRWCERLRGFGELHIDQGTQVADLGLPFAPAIGLAARARLALTFEGRADHAGTTPVDRRADALAAAAELVVAVERLARASEARTTATRIEVEPNANTTVPSHVRLWVDVRAPDDALLGIALDQLVEAAMRAAAPRGVGCERRLESRSPGIAFDERMRGALRDRAGAEVPCFAGHDAGILATRMPAAMVLVRNRSGISHAADEHVELEDAARAAQALLETMEEIA